MLPLKKPVGAGAVAAVAHDATASAVQAMRADMRARRSAGFISSPSRGERAGVPQGRRGDLTER